MTKETIQEALNFISFVDKPDSLVRAKSITNLDSLLKHLKQTFLANLALAAKSTLAPWGDESTLRAWHKTVSLLSVAYDTNGISEDAIKLLAWVEKLTKVDPQVHSVFFNKTSGLYFEIQNAILQGLSEKLRAVEQSHLPENYSKAQKLHNLQHKIKEASVF